jgi:uncharacterized protein YyaL (SSP411 family)
MLYDNALLARLCLHAWQFTGAEGYRQVVTETLDYLLRAPVRLPAGGVASAEDADSEGEEGRFYVWDEAEVLDVGGRVAVDWYGVTPAGNWEGHNILFRPRQGPLSRPPQVEAARQALFERREERVRPGLDDKVLTEWNAMAVAALAEAGAALDRPDWMSAAEHLAGFLLANLRRASDGRWLRSWQGTPGRHLAFAADHAWLIEAFTRLAEATGQSRWIGEAEAAADALLALFADDQSGVLHMTGRDAEVLIARPVDSQDGAVPSANSVAATSLLRLAALTGVERYDAAARAILDALGPALRLAPLAFTGSVASAELARAGLTEVVVTGRKRDLVDIVQQTYLPATVLAWGEPYTSPLWVGRTGPTEEGKAFVCRGYTCQAPTSDRTILASQLGALTH